MSSSAAIETAIEDIGPSALLRAVLEQLGGVAVACFSTHGALVQVNPAARAGLGLDGARSIAELKTLPREVHTGELFDEVLRTGSRRRLIEVPVTTAAAAEPSYWDLSLEPLRLGDSAPLYGIALVGVDVTLKVLARQNLEVSARRKDEFLSLVSHELRTPLVPLVGYADALRKIAAERELGQAPGWDVRIGDYVGKFYKQLKHLEKLTDDLLDVARLDSGKFTIEASSLDLGAVVDRAVEEARMLGRHAGIELSVIGAPLLVLGDDGRLGQLIANLLTNAQRYAGTRPIHVQVSPDVATGVAQVEIRDQGPGIEPRDLPHLFTRFFQARRSSRRKAGLGLGLYIARMIALQHGGDLSVESKLAHGCTFTLRLPLLESSLS